jgi:hypothetical protein
MVRHITAALLLASLALPVAATRPKPGPALESAQFDCDALEISARLDRSTLHDLGPAHSLDEAAAILTKHGVKYERGLRVLTLSGAPPRLLRELNTTKQGEPIILPNGEGSAICVLVPSPDSI